MNVPRITSQSPSPYTLSLLACCIQRSWLTSDCIVPAPGPVRKFPPQRHDLSRARSVAGATRGLQPDGLSAPDLGLNRPSHRCTNQNTFRFDKVEVFSFKIHARSPKSRRSWPLVATCTLRAAEARGGGERRLRPALCAPTNPPVPFLDSFSPVLRTRRPVRKGLGGAE